MKQRNTGKRCNASGQVPPADNKPGHQQPVQQGTRAHRIVVIRDGELVVRRSGR
jgi:hypothetical protein